MMLTLHAPMAIVEGSSCYPYRGVLTVSVDATTELTRVSLINDSTYDATL